MSVEAREGVTTGVSAADRATTIRTIAQEGCTADDLARPGHVYPIRGHPDGVLRRAGQTEGSIDLCRLAGLQPIGVICEVMNPDGTHGAHARSWRRSRPSTTSRSAACAT